MKENQENFSKEVLNKKAMEMADRHLNKIVYEDKYPLIINEGSKIKRIYIVENFDEENEVVSAEEFVEDGYDVINTQKESNEYFKGDFDEDDVVEDNEKEECAPYIKDVRHEVAIEFVCDENTPKSSGTYVPFKLNIVTDASLDVIESKLLECDVEDDILYIDFDE